MAQFAAQEGEREQAKPARFADHCTVPQREKKEHIAIFVFLIETYKQIKQYSQSSLLQKRSKKK